MHIRDLFDIFYERGVAAERHIARTGLLVRPRLLTHSSFVQHFMNERAFRRDSDSQARAKRRENESHRFPDNRFNALKTEKNSKYYISDHAPFANMPSKSIDLIGLRHMECLFFRSRWTISLSVLAIVRWNRNIFVNESQNYRLFRRNYRIFIFYTLLHVQ